MTSEEPAPERVRNAFWHLLVAITRLMGRSLRRLATWNRSGGAGESGLATLVQCHALQAAGDATVTVALAGSLFFSVPTHEARSRVALYLLVTMAPFAVVAPVLGPLLDRFRRGRRTALALSMLARAALAVAISHSLSRHLSTAQTLTLYPAALGVLVAGKSYSIVRSAAVPRLLPPGMTLVQANARLTLVGAIVPGVAGGLAAAVIKTLGHRTELVLGAIVYVLAAVMATRIPRTADGGADRPSEQPTHGGLLRRGQMGVDVEDALRTAATLRWLNGFLLLFGAFVVRVHPLASLSSNVCLGALAIGIGAGNVLGTTIGPRTASLAARRLSIVLLFVTTVVCALTAFDFGLITVFGIAVVAAGSYAVSKLALDATIQRRVDDTVRTSTFARSETTVQLAWVVGGGVGILLPTTPALGFGIATAVLAVGFVVALGARPFRHRVVPAPSPGREDVAVSGR